MKHFLIPLATFLVAWGIAMPSLALTAGDLTADASPCKSPMTNIRFVYPKFWGAPYIVGIGSGSHYLNVCQRYDTVHRWDNEVDSLKKVDDNTRDVVLDFYYTHIEQPCERLAKERALRKPNSK